MWEIVGRLKDVGGRFFFAREEERWQPWLIVTAIHGKEK